MSGASIDETQGVGQYAARAMHAINAGCDTVLVCNNPQGATQVLDYLDNTQVAKSNRLKAMRHSGYSFDQDRFEYAQGIAQQLIA